jgi:hypothetical protein
MGIIFALLTGLTVGFGLGCICGLASLFVQPFKRFWIPLLFGLILLSACIFLSFAFAPWGVQFGFVYGVVLLGFVLVYVPFLVGHITARRFESKLKMRFPSCRHLQHTGQ